MCRGLIALCLLAVATAGCAANAHPAAPTVQPAVEGSLPVMIQGRPLELHLLAPQGSPAANVLVLYASGDGGWFGAAVGMFRRIGEAGYYTAGFSARAFMKIDRSAQAALNPEQVATEYGQIAEAARGGLHLPATTPVVLTGWSRGASLSVLAAAARGTPQNVGGVIAIGLAEGEDLEINGTDDESDDGSATPATRLWPYQPYALLGSLRIPCAVIQATRDNYLSAARARALFGADTEARRFYAVEAKNHRFSGGKEAFDRALTDALEWIVPPSGSTSGLGPINVWGATWRQ